MFECWESTLLPSTWLLGTVSTRDNFVMLIVVIAVALIAAGAFAIKFGAQLV